jgi:microcystin-dependent protein
MSEPFIGEIRIMPYSYAPRFWTWCQGQLLQISSNVALYSILSTTYGGDGYTTMAVPDLSKRAPMHPGRGIALTPRYLGERVGVEEVPLTAQQMPEHTHTIQAATGGKGDKTADNSAPAGNRMLSKLQDVDAGNIGANAYIMEPNPIAFTEMSNSCLATHGQSQGHENRQPFLTVNFCIALAGLYPSRS